MSLEASQRDDTSVSKMEERAVAGLRGNRDPGGCQEFSSVGRQDAEERGAQVSWGLVNTA